MRNTYLATVLIVFFALVAASVVQASDDIYDADETLPATGEYMQEGGDALNQLMRTLVNNRAFNNTLHGLEGNFVVIEEVNARLEENGEINRVRLVARRQENGVYNRELLLEVIPPGEDPFIVRLPDDVRGFQASMAVKNFISRGRSEIFLTINRGIRGERFMIISVADKQGEVIFDTRGTRLPTVVGRFFNDYRAEIIVQETGERAMIDLSSRKEDYHRRFVFHQSGALRSQIVVWVDRLSLFEPVVDNMGIYTIRQIMDMSGAGRADRIAYVESTLKFINGGWSVVDSWISPVEDLRHLPQPRMVS